MKVRSINRAWKRGRIREVYSDALKAYRLELRTNKGGWMPVTHWLKINLGQ